MLETFMDDEDLVMEDEDLDEARKDRIRRVLEEHRRNQCY